MLLLMKFNHSGTLGFLLALMSIHMEK
uniref:Uncharacterized protein n=1 Tax=Arundo donax TaxID=35708 RepID=A0A0A9K5Y8_ARUDO